MSKLRITILAALSFALAGPAAAQWSGLVDRSLELRSDRFSFGAPEGGNENYYDGDFGDFDGDYRMDRCLGARYMLLWNTGDGLMYPVAEQRVRESDGRASGQRALRSFTGMEFPVEYSEDGFQWADVDGDGDPEILMGGNWEPLLIYSNRAGRFSRTGQYNISSLNIANTDIDGDGDVDLAISHAFCSGCDTTGPTDFTLMVNDGNGNFTDETTSRGLGVYDLEKQYVVGTASGDLDRDGDFDLVLMVGLAEYTGVLRNLLAININDGTGNFTEYELPFAYPGDEIGNIGTGFAQNLSLGDIDDDGDLDIVVGGTNTGAQGLGSHRRVAHAIFVNDGEGNFTEESAARWVSDPAPGGILIGGNSKLADFDYDGDLDFVAFNKHGPTFFQLFLNDGDGVFTHRPDLDPSEWDNDSMVGVDVDVADIDHDGTYDLWVGVASQAPNILINPHEEPSGLRADAPRAFRVESADDAGVVLAWENPRWAAVNRHYRVLRSPARGLEPRDRPVVKVVARSPHEDDSFAAPLTRHTTELELNDADVTLDGTQGNGALSWIDRTATPGIEYHYSLVHVGTERNASLPTWELSATRPDPDPTGADVAMPELRILAPTFEEWSRHPRIVLEFADGRSGIDETTLEVFFDVPLGTGVPGTGGVAAGGNIAGRFARRDGNSYVYRLERELALPIGLARLTARVADRAGNQAEQSVLFDVSLDTIHDPTASFTAVQDPGIRRVQFDANSSADTDPLVNGWVDGIIMRYEWDFGDGTTAIGRTVTHRYRDEGDYTVRLMVRDNDGGVDIAEQVISVVAPDADTDGDTIPDSEEIDAGTDPDRVDTDGDTIPDGDDCLVLDDRAGRPAGEVGDVRAFKFWGIPLVIWRDDTASWGRTHYQVLSGSLDALAAGGLDATGACPFPPSTAAVLPDFRTEEGNVYYVVRATTACGATAEWGQASDGSLRTASACP